MTRFGSGHSDNKKPRSTEIDLGFVLGDAGKPEDVPAPLVRPQFGRARSALSWACPVTEIARVCDASLIAC